MQLGFFIFFAIIFFVIVLCIFIFRKYKIDYISTIDNKKISLRLVLGFCALCTDLLYKVSFFRKSNKYKKTKELISSLYVGESSEENMYLYHLKLMSYIVVSVLIGTLLGLVYSITSYDNSSNKISEIQRPSNGDGSQNISLITDSELYSGSIDLTIENQKYSFDEVMDIFFKNRASFDKYVLSDNISFLYIDSPLNLPTTWGDENISISWFISSSDIIDYSGILNSENITPDGVPLEIVATMTLDDFSADICYQLMVFPPKLSDKDKIENYINSVINSSEQLTKDTISLPNNIFGFDISYSEGNKVYPTMDIFNYHLHTSYYPIFA